LEEVIVASQIKTPSGKCQTLTLGPPDKVITSVHQEIWQLVTNPSNRTPDVGEEYHSIELCLHFPLASSSASIASDSPSTRLQQGEAAEAAAAALGTAYHAPCPLSAPPPTTPPTSLPFPCLAAFPCPPSPKLSTREEWN